MNSSHLIHILLLCRTFDMAIPVYPFEITYKILEVRYLMYCLYSVFLLRGNSHNFENLYIKKAPSLINRFLLTSSDGYLYNLYITNSRNFEANASELQETLNRYFLDTICVVLTLR